MEHTERYAKEPTCDCEVDYRAEYHRLVIENENLRIENHNLKRAIGYLGKVVEFSERTE